LNSRAREAQQRFADRRKREDDSPRLSEELPNLAALKLTVEERRPTAVTAESKYVRHVIVDRAPALFDIPCGDPSCSGGGHDVTQQLMRQLRANTAEVMVEHECQGGVGTSHCGRILRVIGTPTYR
jgi:hypothetical protein